MFTPSFSKSPGGTQTLGSFVNNHCAIARKPRRLSENGQGKPRMCAWGWKRAGTPVGSNG